MQVLLAQITLQSVLIYFGIGFIVWYIVNAIESSLNGGSFGRGRGWVFKCFWEEMWWFLPGGLKLRMDCVREMVGENHNGYVGGYSYEEIRKHNLYERVAKRSFGNGFYFWGVSVILTFFLWPLAILALFTLVALNGLMAFASIFFPSLR